MQIIFYYSNEDGYWGSLLSFFFFCYIKIERFFLFFSIHFTRLCDRNDIEQREQSADELFWVQFAEVFFFIFRLPFLICRPRLLMNKLKWIAILIFGIQKLFARLISFFGDENEDESFLRFPNDQQLKKLINLSQICDTFCFPPFWLIFD